MNTILICDDDRDIVSALDIYLTSEGYATVKAYDGLECLAAVERQPVDLILLDVMMPGLDGIRTTAKLRESCNVPIILLTAKSEDSRQDPGPEHRGGRLHHQALQPHRGHRPGEEPAAAVHQPGGQERRRATIPPCSPTAASPWTTGPSR